MTTLTRNQALSILNEAGWPFYLSDIMVAIGAQESSLHTDAQGPTNSDGTIDYGWLQINSRYITGPPFFNLDRLLTDPVYAAKCGLSIFKTQGVRAWAAFNSGDYKKFLPPHLGGPPIGIGSQAWFLVADLQDELNKDPNPPVPLLRVDGSFGLKSRAALQRWQILNVSSTDGTARLEDTIRLIP